jgi:thiol-disulfide isomerase/thioredoxin
MSKISRKTMLRLASWTIAAVALVVVFQGFVQDGVARYDSKTAAPPADVSTNVPMKQVNGEPLRLSDYQGKVVLLNFWASWCPPCREEIPRFAQWQKQYGGQGLQVIGIAMDDDPVAAEEAMRSLGINYPVVVGSAEIAEHFGGIFGLPFNFVLGRNGEIVSRRAGQADFPALERLLLTQLAQQPPKGKP